VIFTLYSLACYKPTAVTPKLRLHRLLRCWFVVPKKSKSTANQQQELARHIHRNRIPTGDPRAAVGMAFQYPYPSHTHRNPHWNPHGNPHTHGIRSKYSITCRPTIPHRQILAVC